MGKKTRRLPSVLESVIGLILVIGVIITGIRLGIGAPMSLLLGTMVATLIAFYLRNSWEDIQKEMIRVVGDSLVAIIILMIVGMLIGIWIIGGTVPALIYYGLQVATPATLLPMAFILCAFTSIATGTSFGTISTMGLALVGVGIGLDMPPHVVAGAVVSGAYFGDKISPLSDTTNMAAAMTGVGLYPHIGSMFYTTIPATILCIIIYTILGLQYAGGAMDTGGILILSEGLSAQFSMTPIALIPAALVLVLSAMKVPAILALGICLVVSFIFAMILQGEGFVSLMRAAFAGFRSETGVPMVDTLLTRGGLTSMQNTVSLIILACMMGGALTQSGILGEMVNGMLKIIKKPTTLVIGTMVYIYTILLLSGNQILGIILGGRTFQPAYKEMDVDARVLARTIEGTTTIGAPLVPWSVASLFITSVLGVTTAYIPYTLLGFIVPIFVLVCAFTGFGMWKADGTPMWGEKGKKTETV